MHPGGVAPGRRVRVRVVVGVKLTKTGQPRMGASITLRLEDGSTETAKVIGKACGKGGSGHLVAVLLEWPDGVRQWAPWPAILDSGDVA